MKKVISVIMAAGLLSAAAFAQHDMQRNSARLLAQGRIDRAVRDLRKQPDRPESLFLLAVAECLREPLDGYPEEREEIFSFLAKNEIERVVLVSADRHRSDIRLRSD
jgi:phosphodiesterase/alkaline phosphatase D-like protein